MSVRAYKGGASTAGRVALVVAAILFGVFLVNVLLGFAGQNLELGVTPFFGRVAEFATLLLAALAFGIVTLLRERLAASADDNATEGET